MEKEKGLSRVWRCVLGIVGRVPVGVASCVAVAAVLWLTLAPKPLPDNDFGRIPGLDKIVHACMFGGLFLIICADVAARGGRDAARGRGDDKNSAAISAGAETAAVVAGVVSVAFGAVIELTQDAMGLGRGGDLWDFIADAAGVAAAAFILRRVQWRCCRLER